MEETTIDLHFRPKDFREIYYSGGKASIFTYSGTRMYLLLTIAGALVSGLFYFLSLQSDSINFIVPCVLSVIVTLICFMMLIVAMIRYCEWKRSVEVFIKRSGSYKLNKIILNEACIQIIQDKEQNIEKWESLNSVNVQDNFISITGSATNYIFPAKSMQPVEFELLTTIIKERITNKIPEVNDLK